MRRKNRAPRSVTESEGLIKMMGQRAQVREEGAKTNMAFRYSPIG